MPELPVELRVEKLTIHDLRKMAKEKNIRGIWGLNKKELQDLLFPENEEWDTSTMSTLYEDQEDQNNAQEKNAPENANTKKVGVQNVK
jgi:hypothetical protein